MGFFWWKVFNRVESVYCFFFRFRERRGLRRVEKGVSFVLVWVMF